MLQNPHGMKKSDIRQMPEYFDRYIHLVKEDSLWRAFDISLLHIEAMDVNLLESIGDAAYAPGKWTVREIIQHLTDWERIFCYRTLIFVRDEEATRQGFDENYLAQQSKANHKKVSALLHELLAVRQATIALFRSFDEADFSKTILTYQHKISVLAMAFNIIGHQVHHFGFMKTHYYPLA